MTELLFEHETPKESKHNEILINGEVSDSVSKEFVEMCHEAKELHKKYKGIEKLLNDVKDKIKEKAGDLGIKSFKDDVTNIAISEAVTETLNEKETIQYLKDKGLQKYIKTKEYFELDDILYGVKTNEINASDIDKFRELKKYTRITIK